MKKLTIALFSFLFVVTSAQASVIRSVDMNFQSGAQFIGDVTFADGYTSVLAVDGTLSGYQLGHTGYLGSGSDHINWVWSGGSDFASDPLVYGTFLMDGASNGAYSNWIAFTYNFADVSNISFSASAYGNEIDYNDPMVSGTLSAVPEPGTLALFGLGLLGAMFARKRNAT